MSSEPNIEVVKLSRKTESNRTTEAIFVPDAGMNLISLRQDSYEVMDGNTVDLFEERFAGLGALIGPHFHRRPDNEIPPLPKKDLFPHIEAVLAKGVKDPFSHGIARYVPWKYTTKDNRIFASVDGSDTYDGIALKDLEGQDFRMSMEVHLKEEGLAIRLKVASEKPSVCGLHYYYRIPSEESKVFISSSNLQDKYRSPDGKMHKMLDEWKETIRDEDGKEVLMYTVPVTGSMDHSFFPKENVSYIGMRNDDYIMSILQENAIGKSWQVFHPEGASYVCVEPISCENPRNAESTESEVSVLINVGAVPEFYSEGSDSENG